MKPTFKPKKALIHVPGHGVVRREDFGDQHTKALLKRAESAGVDQDKFITQHLVISGYGDLPIFEAPEDNGQGEAEDIKPKAEKPKNKGGRPKKKKTDDEILEEEIAKEAELNAVNE